MGLIGFDWLCFDGGRRRGSFTYSFVLTEFTFILAFLRLGLNWVCFGFVFAASKGMKIIIMLCHNPTYVRLVIQKIGFVLHKRVCGYQFVVHSVGFDGHHNRLLFHSFFQGEGKEASL